MAASSTAEGEAPLAPFRCRLEFSLALAKSILTLRELIRIEEIEARCAATEPIVAGSARRQSGAKLAPLPLFETRKGEDRD
jgi:hypothetical protein